jgi:integrase/recombinase XerD
LWVHFKTCNMSKSNVLTFYPILEKRQLKNELYPVSLIVYFNKIKRRYRLKNIQLSVDDWKKMYTPNFKNNTTLGKIKEKIAEKLMEANAANEVLKLNNIDFSFGAFENEFFKKTPAISKNEMTFEQCTKSYIKDVIHHKSGKTLSIKSIIMYDTVLHSLDRYKKNLLLKDITSGFITKYEKYLSDNGKTLSTIGIYLRQIRAVMNYAVNKEVNLLDKDKYPFENYSIPSSEPNKRALNDSELKALINHIPISKQEETALDFWKFSYLGNGLNFNDIARLKYGNIKGGVISFEREKTKNKKKVHKEITIYLLPEIQAIINKHCNIKENENTYVFNILNENMLPIDQYKAIQQFIKTTNNYLKRISIELNFDFNLTTYFARHSYATKMRNSGVSVSFISNSLGHSSIATTENYLGKFPDQDIKNNANKLLDL